ncbi:MULTISPECIES: hypothetical protein [unclassified Bradyrhizobium]|uniref:hypothetical protein n=1 Tax=unclassified Bradyrhizobium TaxID=2631580 RepID=UPI00247B25A3|nr:MULTISPECIES: hypothetical protein [unclassified Bradyrhizobium]WGS20180.1 hypothetical protein MTX22_38825 [Bradyrhizobium sp. ISRA463]WGS27043.1 hypothetical protein MTX19_36250 [Bradyrhizobium sp. ISRA464]
MHDLLGLKSLSGAPALLSGYRSITRHPALGKARTALRNLRLIGVNIESEAHLQEAVIEARAWEDDHASDDDYVEPPFEISTDPGTGFAIRERVRRDDARRNAMLDALLGVLPNDIHNLVPADHTRRFRFRIDGDNGSDVICDTREIMNLPPRPATAQDKASRAPIVVTIEELENIARTLDEEDARDPARVPRNFLTRLRSEEGQAVFSVLSPQGAALRRTDVISLDSVSHMIGLPGAGKSTLIFLLVVLLARQGRRITLLVPSIEFALALDADLTRYSIPTALLVGQSPDARRSHSTRLAERIATMDSGGFGQTAPGAELLGTRCALSAFVSVPPPAFEFPHDRPPCTSLRQASIKKDGKEGKEGYRSCPLATACGRQRSARRLADADALVQIGHVISTEVMASPHFHTERMRHFERVARTSDLVIIDEVDGAQAALDQKGFAELDLFGSSESYETILLDDVFDPVASGRGFAVSNSIENYTLASNRFMRLNRALRAHLLERMAEEGGVLARFKDAFVTGNSILASMYLDPETDEEEHGSRRFDLVRRLFEQLVRSVLASDVGGDGEDDLSELDLERVARDLEIDHGALISATTRFRGALNSLLNVRLVERFEENYDEMRDAFFGILPHRQGLDPQEARILFRFLVEVTTVVLQFLALVPAQYAMIAEGVHTERVFGQGVTADLRRTLPESLIGRLSGIRFAYETNDRGQRSLRLQYLSFAGVPRLLLYHLSELLTEDGIKGPAVLMASATSYLAPSPSYHVPVRPSYVLRREGESDAWRHSAYAFLPVRDPDRPGEFVRVSGAGSERERNHSLRLLTDHFFSGADPLVRKFREDQFDPGRRTGIVVNSYEQVAFIKAHLRRTSSSAHRVIGVTSDIRNVPSQERAEWVSASQVEMLGTRDDWDALVFPMKAIGRGVNIVFPDGSRVRDAVLGNIAFFVRPHPTADSLAFTGGLAGQLALRFDQRVIPPNADLAGLAREWRSARDEALDALRWLLRRPQQMSRLGRMIRPFVADGMVDLLQTIGRAMRNGCKTRVFFVDASFAPQSAKNRRDTQRTSMIVAMRDVLEDLLSCPDPVEREIYRLLYEPFLHPLRHCAHVIFPEMDPE